jgi:hypothetical protein
VVGLIQMRTKKILRMQCEESFKNYIMIMILAYIQLVGRSVSDDQGCPRMALRKDPWDLSQRRLQRSFLITKRWVEGIGKIAYSFSLGVLAELLET